MLDFKTKLLAVIDVDIQNIPQSFKSVAEVLSFYRETEVSKVEEIYAQYYG